MIELYYRPGAASFVAHATLEEAGAEYQLILVEGRGSPEFLALNPLGRVPTMTLDGMTMTEAAACVMYISDLYPDAHLAPAVGTPARAQWYRWLTYLTNTVQMSFINYFRPERAAPEEATEAVKRKAVDVLVGLRNQIEAHLADSGPYVLGEQFSSADLFLAMLTRWGRNLDPKWWDQPHLGEHWRRIRARPALERVYEQEGLEE